MNRQTLCSVQFVECWLPLTENWLYKHLKALPPESETFVVSQWTQNLAQFPWKNLISLEQPPASVSIWKRGLRRLELWDDRERHLPLLEKAICERKPHVLHSHFGPYGWFNSGLSRKYGVPHVVSFYGFDVGYLPKGDPRWFRWYRKMSSRVDRVLCEGPHMAQSIAALGIDPMKIREFRLGIDLDLIPFLPRHNPVEKETLRVLIAGSFREKKGIPYAIEALGRFHGSFPNLEITVVGGSSGSDREEHEKQIIFDAVRRCGLSEKTRFLGYQPYERLREEFYRHHVFLSPSVTSSDGDTEGGAPVTIIEAAASGMPVVSTTHCDIPYVLSEENRMFLAPERDVSGLVRALEELLARKDWSSIVTANRRLVEKELDLKTQGKKLDDIYRELTNGTAQQQQ